VVRCPDSDLSASMRRTHVERLVALCRVRLMLVMLAVVDFVVGPCMTRVRSCLAPCTPPRLLLRLLTGPLRSWPGSWSSTTDPATQGRW